MELSLLVYISYVVIDGLSAGTIVLVMKKYGMFDAYDTRRKAWMPEVCFLCMCFWICALIFVFGIQIVSFKFEWWFLFVPFTATSLTYAITK